jgi:hypothetical protein
MLLYQPTQGSGWWAMTCDSGPSAMCFSPSSSKDADFEVADVGQGDPKVDGCDPSIFTISSQKTIGSYLSFGYGIIGLYFTVVFTIGRFVHMSVVGMKYGIIYDDLPRVEVLKELCETIFLARMYKNLPLEEELYRELIDIYRRPSL